MPGYVQGMRRPEVVQTPEPTLRYSARNSAHKLVPYRIVDRAHLVKGTCRSSSRRDSSALANVGMAPPTAHKVTNHRQICAAVYGLDF